MSKSTTVETAPTMPDAEDYRAEADFLARVLAHPDVPIDYANYIASIIIEIQGDVTTWTPETPAASLSVSCANVCACRLVMPGGGPPEATATARPMISKSLMGADYNPFR